MFIIIKLQIFQLIRVKLMIPETDFSIRYFIGGYDNNITYLITCNILKTQVIVDAAIDIGMLLPFIDSEPSCLESSNCDTIKSLSDLAKAILASRSRLLD